MGHGEPLISESRRREFHERGLLVMDTLFDRDEIEAVRLECARVYRESLEPEAQGQKRVRPFLPQVHLKSEVVARFTLHPVFQEIARTLIGPDVDQVWNQACLKLPDEGGLTEFPYHQDAKFADLPKESHQGFACFVALGPLTVENGTLHFAAGGHKEILPHTWNSQVNWWECSVEGFEIVPGVLSPGQVILYHALTPHGGPPNRSSGPREALLVSFSQPELRRTGNGELFGDQRALLRGGRPPERA